MKKWVSLWWSRYEASSSYITIFESTVGSAEAAQCHADDSFFQEPESVANRWFFARVASVARIAYDALRQHLRLFVRSYANVIFRAHFLKNWCFGRLFYFPRPKKIPQHLDRKNNLYLSSYYPKSPDKNIFEEVKNEGGEEQWDEAAVSTKKNFLSLFNRDAIYAFKLFLNRLSLRNEYKPWTGFTWLVNIVFIPLRHWAEIRENWKMNFWHWRPEIHNIWCFLRAKKCIWRRRPRGAQWISLILSIKEPDRIDVETFFAFALDAGNFSFLTEWWCTA